ncbi:MAG: acyl-CoA dehydrogenase family protein [Acidimicrobiales bacterium]
MDFELSDEQQAILDLAGQILGDLCHPDRLREHEDSGEPTPAAAWQALAAADLLGVALPEAVGGGGYGVLEASLVAEQVGRHVAPVPFVPTLAAAMVLAEHTAETHAGLLADVIAGRAVLTAALSEGGTDITPWHPETTAERDGARWRLDGEKRFVPWGVEAARVLVPARTGEGTVAVFVVDPAGDGVTTEEERGMAGLPQAAIALSGAWAAAPIGDDAVLRRLVEVSTALVCATLAGVCDGALRLTATHAIERQQFGSPIGTFQAVAHRLADAYIDAEGVQLTARQAAWRMAAGLPAADELHIAKFWASEASHRVVHAAQHVHGGIGVDIDYPVHRYFRWAKSLEGHLGSATEHLVQLGARMAASA